MARKLAAFAVFVVLATGVPAVVVCPSGGFFCLNEESYALCDEENLGSRPATWSCSTGTVCRCGKSDVGPCSWVFETVNGSCCGAAGSIVSDWSRLRHTLDSIYIRAPSQHVPLALSFSSDSWDAQLEAVMNAEFFDDNRLYLPADARSYACSLHPPLAYDTNPTQLWIGRPKEAVLGGNNFLRLPDKLTAMWLAYAMDQYGVNPALLLALMAVRSGIALQDSDSGGYWDFVTGNGNDEVVLSDSIKESGGPYKSSKELMAYDLSIEATRFAANATQPLFVSHLYHTARSKNLAAIHEEWTKSIGRATARTALEMHWIHTVIFTLDAVGMRGTSWEQRTRFGRDSLEFSVAMHVLQNGLFSGKLGANLVACNATLDPATECGLGETDLAKIQSICKAIDESDDLYDFAVTWNLVSNFLDTLEWTHPISSVPSQYDTIDWPSIRANAASAFSLLAAHRKLSGPSYDGDEEAISLTYDWRALLAVVRAGLPGSEPLVGPTMHGIDHAFYGVYSDALYVDVSEWPLETCFVAGGKTDLCAVCVLKFFLLSFFPDRVMPFLPSRAKPSAAAHFTPLGVAVVMVVTNLLAW